MKKYTILLLLMLMSVMPASAQGYINIDKNAYFDTGYKPTAETKIVAKMRLTQPEGNEGLFGVYRYYHLELYTSNHFKAFVNAGDKDNGHYDTSPLYATESDYEITMTSENVLVYAKSGGDEDYHRFCYFSWNMGSDMKTDKSLYIGATNVNNEAGLFSKMKLYDFCIYEKDVLKHHYVPSNYNGTPALYDTKTNTFLYSLKPSGNPDKAHSSADIDPKECHHKYAKIEKADDDEHAGTYIVHCYQCDEQLSIAEWTKVRNQEEDVLDYVDPYLLTSADSANIGATTTMVTCTTGSVSQMVILPEKCDTLVANACDSTQGALSLVFPQSDTLSTYYLLAKYNAEPILGIGYAETYYTPILLKVPPFHTIADLQTLEMQNADEKGFKQPSTKVRVAIDNPDVEDVMSNDRILIQRSYYPDFSTYQTLDDVDIEPATFSKKETLPDGTIRGWYEIIDDDDNATYTPEGKKVVVYSHKAEIEAATSLNETEKMLLNSFYAGWDRPVYYRAVRAMTSSLWGDKATNFEKTDSLLTSSMLPKVTDVAVMKQEDWEENKHVKVTVALDNPYPWEFNAQLDEARVKEGLNNNVARRYVWDDENAQIIVKRYTTDGDLKQQYAAKEFVIKGDGLTWDEATHMWTASIEDNLSFPYINYYYKAVVDTASSQIPACIENDYRASSQKDAENCYSEYASLVNNLVATQGDQQHQGHCYLSWESDAQMCDSLRLERRIYDKEGKGQWSVLKANFKGKDYVDNTALPGKVYEYRLTAMTNYLGAQLQTQKNTLGWSPYYGTIKGYTVMPDGTAIAGVKITIERSGDSPAINIPDVYDEQGNLIMKGVHEGAIANVKPELMENSDTVKIEADIFTFKREIYSDENGYFETDSLLYSEYGTNYDVTADGEFVYNKHDNHAYLTLSAATCQYDVEFVANNYYTYSGRVLYANSTVPVRDAQFRITYKGQPTRDMKTPNGDLVKTDQLGNFSFKVLPKAMRIQVCKPGHTFVDGGHINMGKNGEKQYEFIPNEDKNFTLQDFTRVRLIGRIRGGEQGTALVGLGQSTNNLGDDLTMVLQLEGDNTAQIVYKEDDPDNTTIKEWTANKFLTNNATDNIALDSTFVTYEKRRIVVKANEKTGEFAVDLFPAKYKITQLSATGYGTLFGAGEGFEVLDLTNDTTLLYNAGTITRENEKKTLEGQIAYNRIYTRTYHNPVNVSYAQYHEGVIDKYLGARKMKFTNTQGQRISMEVVNKKGTTAQEIYAFGYPIYKDGDEYTLQVRAHEDYYYNGLKTNRPEVIYLNHGTLKYLNGLAQYSKEETRTLDNTGTAYITFTPDNTTFSQTGEDALRSLTMSVEMDGYYYEADPLMAYVTGEKDKGTKPATVDDGIKVLDVLRDPPGTSSSATLSSGVTYNWTHNTSFTYNSSINIVATSGQDVTGVSEKFIGIVNAPQGIGNVIGDAVGTVSQITENKKTNFPIPFLDFSVRRNAQYSMTLNESISTSSDPKFSGAMSDVYIGTVNFAECGLTSNFGVIDSLTYEACKSAVTLIKASKDINGSPIYLVISDKVAMGQGVKRSFIYPQRHILGVVIPELLEQRDNMLLTGITENDAQNLADNTNQVVYWSSVDKDDDNFGLKGYYTMKTPSSKADQMFADQVQGCNDMIMKWIKVILANEKRKAETISTIQTPFKRYSINDTPVVYSETSAGSDNKLVIDESLLGYNLNKGTWASSLGKAFGMTDFKALSKTEQDIITKLTNISTKTSQTKPDEYNLQITVGGSTTQFMFLPSVSANLTNDQTATAMMSRTVSYTMALADNSYLDVDVYRVPAMRNTIGVGDWVAQAAYDTKYNKQSVYENNRPADFIYCVRGGGTRHPYIPADSTIFYTNAMGKPYPLGAATAKIDNPRIYIKQPVVNNQPQDEKAVFEVVLSNETEMASGVTNLKPSGFILVSSDSSNPNGAKLTIDGQPLTSGRTFYISPGESITKTMEVTRGKGYEFDNLQLQLSDEYFSLTDVANFSVRYLPTSSPVKLSLPNDKWVMNTLSAKDTAGYYLPVQIDGYNLDYENFDHIELQYKKQTEGADQWVNLCSFYDNDSLYQAASGNKQMIDKAAGKITNIRFYGEKDPVEMKYDLRAVTFCRLGTSYVTRSSDIVSGVKDTRKPKVFGLATPTSGILTYEDVLKLDFTEPIAYNYLDKTANFQVWGYTNQTGIAKSNTLHFDGIDTQDASTDVERNLSQRDFTVDMFVKPEKNHPDMVLFSHGNSHSNMAFGLTKDNKLFARFDSVTVYSKELKNPDLALNHVGMTYQGNTSVGTVKFFADNSSESTEPQTINVAYNASGNIHLGVEGNQPDARAPYHGEMLDVRLWGKALSTAEMAEYGGKMLTGYEKQLIAHWPLNESYGDVARDNAHGANLTLKSTNWTTMNGYSLRSDKKPVKLNAQKITASETSDNSVTFWFRVESEESQGNRAALMLAGTGNKSTDDTKTNSTKMFVGFQGDSLVFESGNNTFNLAPRKSMNDQQWHHFAMTVNRANNLFAAYIDGELAVQDDATLIYGMPSDQLTLGDPTLVANFDKFTQWYVALPKAFINEFSNTLLSGKEMGLNAYLPFSYRTTNSSGTTEDYFSPYDESVDAKTGKVIRNDEHLLVKDVQKENMDDTRHAPLRETAQLNNLSFDFTCTDNALQIDLQEKSERLNKQNLFLTVRGVEDLNGNTMESPYMWTVFVDQNVLRWDDRNTVKLSVPYGESASAKLAYHNYSGKHMAYAIAKQASWMQIDEEMGTMEPEQQNEVTLTVDAGLNPGIYTDVLYLVDENNLVDPVTFELTVEAEEPTWKVDKTKFDRTMNLMAEVKVKNASGNYIIDTNTEDRVAAFVDGECVGVANISRAADGSSYLYMTVYGNKKMADAKPVLGFLLWNKLTGRTYEMVYEPAEGDGHTGEYITFETNSAVGCPPNKPVTLCSTDYMEQLMALNEGWNWISFNVAPMPIAGTNTILLDPNHLMTDGDIFKHVTDGQYAQYNEEYKSWLGTLAQTDYKNVYQVMVNNGGTYKVMGRRLKDEELKIDVKAGWNELPYLLQYSKPIEQALTDFQIGDKASEGDIIKSLDEFAVASKDKGTWIGSLRYMRPGQGYYLMHTGQPTSFYYKDDNVTTSTASFAKRKAQLHSTSMPVIARFADDVETAEGDQLAAYVGSTLVGRAESILTPEGEQVFFLNVNAEEGDIITFAQERDGEVVARTHRKVGYNSTSVVGSLETPYAVSFTDTTESTGYYDLQGRRMPDSYKPLQHGVYIKDGKKVTK